jgi:broad specificity phosphatase PhoE
MDALKGSTDSKSLIVGRPSFLVLMRHGESMRNVAKKGTVYFADDYARSLVRGTPDHLIQLTEKGEGQAKQVGRGLKSEFGLFDYAYHSGYERTDKTLSLALEAYSPEEREKIQVRKNPFLRERDAGYTYDMTEEEAERFFPWLKEYWKTTGGFFARPPGGESLADVIGRLYLFINKLFRDHAGKRILVSTHGGTIRCFRFLLERWDYQRALSWPSGQAPANCGITVYRFNPEIGRLELAEYNKVYSNF